MDHVADGEPLAGQDLLEISATAGIDPLISGPGDANVAAIRCEQQNIADVVGQLFFDLAQQRVIGVCVGEAR